MAHLDNPAGVEPALVVGDGDRSYVDWPAVLALVNGLPDDQAQAPRMRYWRARALDGTFAA